VVLLSGFSSHMRPLTLTLPLPLLEFCNKTLLMHQLQALKDAGVSEVIFCVHERFVPKSWDESIKACEADLGMRITTSREDASLGTAGPLKHAQSLITDDGANDSPFFVVNSDVLCSYPLRDLLHTHVRHGREGTVLVTRTEKPSNYGVVVCDERSGRVRHFVEKPETYVSDLINAGVYVFSPSIFGRIPAAGPVSMNEVLPAMALEEQLHSLLLTGYWAKIVDSASFMEAVGPHLEITRFMSKASLSAPGSTDSRGGFTIRGNVMIHPTAKVGPGCVIGPDVVIGAECEVQEGVRLEAVTLLQGVRVQANSFVKNSLLGWSSQIGKWCHVLDSVFGEAVEVRDSLLVRGATVLPHKEISASIREAQIVI